MSTSPLYLVFSEPSERVSEEEFLAWYDRHLPEILETDGFESAQRYRVEAVVSNESGGPRYRYLVLWEISKDIETLRAELVKRSESGEIVLPDWFKETLYMTWTCMPVGGRYTRAGVED
jgi:hypothetical protein